MALLTTTDDAGPDAKILCVPTSKVTSAFDDVNELEDVPALVVQQIEHFFAHYKDLEPGKVTEVGEWRSRDVAESVIAGARQRYLDR